MKIQECPECNRRVYQLYKQGAKVGCAYCLNNLWAINEEKRIQEREATPTSIEEGK